MITEMVMGDDKPKGSQHPHRRTLLSIGFILACAMGLTIYLFCSGDIALVPRSLTWPSSAWLIAAIVLVIAWWLVESAVLWYLARGLLHPISFWVALRANMVMQVFNNITPFAAGGQPMEIWSLWRDRVPVGESTCLLVAKFAVYQAMLVLFSTLALVFEYPFFASIMGGWMFLVIIAYIVQVGVLVFVALLLFKPRIMHALVRALKRLLLHMRHRTRVSSLILKLEIEMGHYERSSVILRGSFKVLAVGCLITCGQLILFFSVPWCVCNFLGVDAPYLSTVAAAVFVLMVSGLVPLPGGSGGAEGLFMLVFSPLLPAEVSVAVAAFLWRAVTFYLSILAGAFFCIGAPVDDKAEELVEKLSEADGCPTKPSGSRSG